MFDMSRLATLTVAALVPASLGVVAPVLYPTAAPRAVSSHVEKHRLDPVSHRPADRNLTPAESAEARNRAGGRAAAVRAASAPVGLPGDVAVVGVTWAGTAGDGASVQYRTFTDGRWGPWRFSEVDQEHGPDGREGAADGVRDGSDPLVVTGAEQIQVRLIGATAAAAPIDPELVVVDPGSSPADVALDRPGSAVAAARRPYIYTRAQWGADESLRDPAGPSYGSVRAAWVHHTADTNSYTSDQVPAILRGIYAFHVNGRGWSDIGYNFLVDRFGRTWEGRYGGTTRPVIGAHAYGVNSYTFGVSVMGNFDVAAVPAAVTTAVTQLIGWKAQIHEINLLGKARITGHTYNAVSGHRDAADNSTACPGRYLYAQLPTIRANAAALTRGLPSLSLDRDLDNLNDADILATNADKDLLLYPTTNSGTVLAPKSLSSGSWSGVDQPHVVGDWNGDGAVDLVARITSSGELRLYPGTGAGTIGPSTRIGTGWGSITAIIAPGDWDGDGRPDLLARMADNTLRIYPGNGAGSFLRPSTIGNGWGGMRLISGIGDWDGDGARDLLAVTSAGSARVYRGSGSGGFAGYINLLGDWSGRASVVGVGDATWDTKADLFSVSPTGEASIGVKGASPSEVRWSPVSTSFAGVRVYSS
jgi:hypothetical protein